MTEKKTFAEWMAMYANKSYIKYITQLVDKYITNEND